MVWLERFALALLALVFWNWVMNNGLHIDGHYRVALGLVLLGVSYGVGHAVYVEAHRVRTHITQVPSASPAEPSSLPPNIPAPTIDQKATNSPCSNTVVIAGKDAKVDCSSGAENKDATKKQ